MSNSDSQSSNIPACAICGKPPIGIHSVPSPPGSDAFQHSPGVLYCDEHRAEALGRATRLASEADKTPKS